jgi:hypothetical protein
MIAGLALCTRSLNWPCTRSAGIRDSSLAGDSLQRPISFRLGQVTDEVVSLMCPEVPEGTRCLSHSRANAAHAGKGNRHAQSESCGHGSPRMQGSREDARCMSIGRGGRPLRGCARARRVAMLRSPERAHAASDMGRAVRCGHAGKTHTVVSRRGPRGSHAAATSCHTQGRATAVRRGPGEARTADIK